MADVDVLAPSGSAGTLRSALLAAGFAPLGASERGEHELPGVVSKGGIVVDVHRHLPGVRLPGERGFATFAALDARGELDVAAGWPAGTFLPSRRVLVAHALAHGIAQSGFAPRSHPFLRLFADLLDLGLADAEGDEPSVGAVARAEAAAARKLCLALAAGEEPPDGSPERELLGHALAGALDERYRRWLSVRALASAPSSRPAPLALAARMRGAVLIGEGEARAIYGPSAGLLRRLARPFDLLWRLGRAVASGVALRAGPPLLAGGPPGKVPEITGTRRRGQ